VTNTEIKGSEIPAS